VDYEKQPCNPVIDGGMVPEGNSVHDFRDPKIWREGDSFYAVMGNRSKDGSGEILLFKSGDAQHWEFVSVVSSCHNQYGRMWECPDFFPLDGKDVLLVSPQEMDAIGLEFHPGNANVCLTGSFDRKTHHLMRDSVQAIDYGLDFYAPQTLLTEDGRRVMIGWMQNWETSTCKQMELRFMGQMTLPRELSIRNGRLCQNPVRELEQYRGVRIDYYNVLINGETSLRGISGRCTDMTVTVRPGNENSMYKWFRLYVARDGEHFTLIRYRPDTNTIKVDRTHSGFPHDIVNVREFPVSVKNGVLKLRVIMDRYSLELFVNDGEQAASFVLYTPETAGAVSFSSDGSVLVDVEKYDLEIK
jgi:beta-fructofuranosidase